MPPLPAPVPSPASIQNSADSHINPVRVQLEPSTARVSVTVELVEPATPDSESAIAELKRRLDHARQWIKLQREAVELRKQARHFITSDPTQPWAYRWIASVVAYCCSEEMREEFLGDLFEANRQLSAQNYPRWLINAINVVQVIRLLASIVEVRLSTWLTLWSKK